MTPRGPGWLAALRIALGPILLWQGARVRRTILRVPEPSGPRSGPDEAPDAVSLLLLGDSSIAGVGAETQSEALSGRLIDRLSGDIKLRWQVLGTTGWTTQDAFDALRAQPPGHTDFAVIALGVNDVTTETGIPDWISTFDALISDLRHRHSARLIVVSGLPPMGAFPALPQPLRWYLGQQAAAHQDALFRYFADAPDIACLPLVFDLDVNAMCEDGFHPGPHVYDAWAADVARIIRQRWRATPPHPAARATDAAHPSSETEPSSARSRHPVP